MAFEIKKPDMPQKTFILNRNLHLDKDNHVVEEDDPAGVKVLGTEGKAFYEEEAKSYGLDDSHRKAEEVAHAEPETGLVIEKEPEQSVAEQPPAEAPEELKGKLPPDFPGHAALAEAGINTYGQLRKAVAKGAPDSPWYADITGIADKTAEKIEERLAAIPEDAE